MQCENANLAKPKPPIGIFAFTKPGRILPVAVRRLWARNTSRIKKRRVNDLAIVYFTSWH
jgi:hypothetical protein